MTSPSTAAMSDEIQFLYHRLRLFKSNYERLHELAYERGSAPSEKIMTSTATPTEDLALDEGAEAMREKLQAAAAGLKRCEIELGGAINHLTDGLRAASPGLPTRGVTRYSQSDVDGIEHQRGRNRYPENLDKRPSRV